MIPQAFQILAEIVIVAGIGQGFLVSFLYPFRKRSHQATLLSFLLIVLSLVILSTYYLNPMFQIEKVHPFMIEGPFIFLLGPLLFFYLRNIVSPKETITRKDLPHFLLFLLFFMASIPVYIHGIETTYVNLLRKVIGSPWIFLLVQISYYLVKARGLVRSHKRNIEQRFSNVEGINIS